MCVCVYYVCVLYMYVYIYVLFCVCVWVCVCDSMSVITYVVRFLLQYGMGMILDIVVSLQGAVLLGYYILCCSYKLMYYYWLIQLCVYNKVFTVVWYGDDIRYCGCYKKLFY